jgi:hypothetical protein
MARHSLTIETFLAVAEMIAAQLRIKEADRWSAAICKLKFVSFTTDFPEVTDPQFLWAAEQWLQSTGGKDFLRYPTWRELMAPLYRTENGLANRSWGFRETLPPMCQPTPAQLQLMPATPQSIAGPPDSCFGGVLTPFVPDHRPRLPPPVEGWQGLTPEDWAAYLLTLAEADAATDERGRASPDPGTRTADGQVVSPAVQQESTEARATEP